MKGETIKIGLMSPLSGIASLYGEEISWAGGIACNEINRDGGILGRTLELVIVDDGSLPETAVPAAEALIDHHGCVALVGSVMSNSRIAIATRVAEPRRVPYLNFSFYEGSIFSPYFFHFSALPNQQISRMIPYMEARFGPKMYFAGSNYEWPLGSIDAAKRALLAAGGEVAGEEYFELGCDDFPGLLERVEKSGADVFVPYAVGADQIALLRQFAARGLKAKIAVATGHFDETMAARLAPAEREDIYSCSPYYMSLETDENRRFLQQLVELPGADGVWPRGGKILTHFGEAVYHCITAFAQAVTTAGSAEPRSVVRALEKGRTRGPQGLVTMDAETHHAEVSCYLARCRRDGSFAIEESFGRIWPAVPSRYTQVTRRHRLDSPGPYSPGDAHPENWRFLGVARTEGKSDHRLKPSRMRTLKLPYFNHVLENINRHLRERGLDLARHERDENEVISFVVEGLDRRYAGAVALKPFEGMEEGGVHATYYAVFGLLKDHSGNVPKAVADEPPTYADGAGNAGRDAAILNHADASILTIDEQGIIVQANKKAALQFGYPAAELVGLSVHHLLPPSLRRQHREHVDAFIYSPIVEQHMAKRAEIIGYRKDGSTFPALATLSKFDMGGAVGVVATLVDTTEHKQAERELQWRASHDPLTGLPNRGLLNERLENAIQRAGGRKNSLIAVLFVDLDNFKLVNDNYGHEVGDQLLIAIANRFLNVVPPGVTVARFGGDEFVVLLDKVENEATAEALAGQLIKAFEEPLHLVEPDMLVYASVSIGIALEPGGAASALGLLSNADAAMYSAKERGRNGWRVFDRNISNDNKLQIEIANGLHKCILNRELSLVYQPILDLRGNRIVASEALLRWQRDGRPVSPAMFIPIAEKNGMIPEIGLWVFEQACLEQVRRAGRLPADRAPVMSINLSPRQLEQPALVEQFTAVIEATGVDARQLVLELTETSLMSDVNHTVEVLADLTALGLSFAVDDFGTGYSSLSQLKQMPVTTLKIDRVFVDGIDSNLEHRAITEAIIRMAHVLGIKVTAEGVETRAQLEVLQTLECDFAQGYFFHRPMPAEQFWQLVD